MTKRDEKDRARMFDEGLDRLAALNKQFDMELGALRQVAREITGSPAPDEVAPDEVAAQREQNERAEDAG